MKLYVGDWLAKTLQMDAACQGAYLLMIMAHWGKPHLTFNNEDEMRCLCRVPIQDWARVKATIVQKFEVVDGNKWVNDRCVREYNEAVELYNARQNQTSEARKANPKHLLHESLQSMNVIVTNPDTNDATKPYPQPQPEPESKSDSKRSLREETPFQKRSRKQQETWIELAGLCREVLGEKAYADEPQWYQRIQTDPNKLRRVLSDLRLTMREQAIDNPPAYAETLWKEFK